MDRGVEEIVEKNSSHTPVRKSVCAFATGVEFCRVPAAQINDGFCVWIKSISIVDLIGMDFLTVASAHSSDAFCLWTNNPISIDSIGMEIFLMWCIQIAHSASGQSLP